MQFANEKRLDKLMNGDVKETLGLNATFINQSDDVYENLHGDLMKPVDHIGTELDL